MDSYLLLIAIIDEITDNVTFLKTGVQRNLLFTSKSSYTLAQIDQNTI